MASGCFSNARRGVWTINPNPIYTKMEFTMRDVDGDVTRKVHPIMECERVELKSSVPFVEF